MKYLVVSAILLGSIPVLRADDKKATREKVMKVYEDRGALVVETKEGLKRIEMEKDLNQSNGYEVKLHPRTFVDASKKVVRQQLSLEEAAELKRLQYEAQTLYEKKDYGAAWKKVSEALEIEPWNTQLMNMKGSILYLTGSPELAVAFWRESLAIDPNQESLQSTLKKVEESLPKAEGKRPADQVSPEAGKAVPAAEPKQ